MRDIQTHDERGMSTCVAPSASVAAISSRYQASSGVRPPQVEHGLDVVVTKGPPQSARAASAPSGRSGPGWRTPKLCVAWFQPIQPSGQGQDQRASLAIHRLRRFRPRAIPDLPGSLLARGASDRSHPGELLDQEPIVAIDVRVGARPGEARDRLPGLLRRVPLVADQVRGVRQAGPMMPRDAVEEDRLAAGIGHQVGGRGPSARRVAREPRIGTINQRMPVSSHEPPLALGTSDRDELIAVSVTIVRMPSRCDDPPERPRPLPGPRTSRPGSTTWTRFSNQSSRCSPSQARPAVRQSSTPASA